jgi:hypothetical protein
MFECPECDNVKCLELNVVRVLKCQNVKVRNSEVSMFNVVEVLNADDAEITKREDIEI